MPSPRQVALWLVAAAGALCGHELGYHVAALPASPGVGTSRSLHAYVPVASAVLTPAAVLAVLLLAVRSARSAGLRDVRVRRLALLQLGICAAQEVLERLPSGSVGQVLHDPGVRWALAAQLVVAVAVAALLRSAARAVAVIAAAGVPTRPHQPQPPAAVGRTHPGRRWWCAPAVRASDVRRRGPPLRPLTA